MVKAAAQVADTNTVYLRAQGCILISQSVSFLLRLVLKMIVRAQSAPPVSASFLLLRYAAFPSFADACCPDPGSCFLSWASPAWRNLARALACLTPLTASGFEIAGSFGPPVVWDPLTSAVTAPTAQPVHNVNQPATLPHRAPRLLLWGNLSFLVRRSAVHPASQLRANTPRAPPHTLGSSTSTPSSSSSAIATLGFSPCEQPAARQHTAHARPASYFGITSLNAIFLLFRDFEFHRDARPFTL